MKVFLGGTCPQSKDDIDYRIKLISILEQHNIDYFNPVVDDWTEDCAAIEQQQKEICDIHLYIITPNIKGCYSIAEAFASLIDRKRSIFVYCKQYNNKTFDPKMFKSIEATGRLFADYSTDSWILDSEEDIDDQFVSDILNYHE